MWEHSSTRPIASIIFITIWSLYGSSLIQQQNQTTFVYEIWNVKILVIKLHESNINKNKADSNLMKNREKRKIKKSNLLIFLLLSLKLLLCEDLLLCFVLQIQRKKKTNIRFSELKQRQKQFRIIRTIILEPWNERRSRFVSLGDTKLDVNNGLALLRKSSDIDQRENEPARAYWNVLYFLLLTLIQQRKIEIWVSKADRLGPVG